jgi:hypothetical protein
MVTVVAIVHMGTSAYFGELNAIVAGLEGAGAVVCYEGISAAAEEEWAAATDGERAVRGITKTVDDRGRSAACRYLGWVEQTAALHYSPSWRNVDMTDLEFVRQAQPHNVSEHSGGINTAIAGLTPDRLEALAGAGGALLLRVLAVDYFNLLYRLSARASGDAHRRFGRVMVEERNRGALARLPSDVDAVLLWGSGHLLGLAEGLKKAGYRRRSTTWVSVGELPAVWTCLRAFRASLRALGAADSAPAPDDAAAPGYQA